MLRDSKRIAPRYTEVMRILLVASIFPPHNGAGAVRTYGFARSWADAGMDVTVLTTPKQPDQIGFDAPMTGFTVHEVPFRVPSLLARLRASTRPNSGDTGAPASASPLRNQIKRWHRQTGVFGASRMPDLTDFWVRPACEWAMQQQPWDVVVSSSGPYTTHLIASRLRQAGHARFWAADYRDLWTDNHVVSGLFPFTVAERVLEKQCLERADLLTTVSEPLAAQLARRANKPVQVIRNGALACFSSTLPQANYFHNDEDRFRLLYTGTVYPPDQNPDVLFEGIAELRRSEPSLAATIQLVVAGDRRELWTERATAYGASDVLDHRGRVSRTDAWRMQRDADALLILDWQDRDAGVLTSKVFEYLMAGPPILAVGGDATSPVGKMLRSISRGTHAGSRPVDVAHSLTQLMRDAKKERPQVNCDDLREFTIEHQAIRFLELIDAALHSAASHA